MSVLLRLLVLALLAACHDADVTPFVDARGADAAGDTTDGDDGTGGGGKDAVSTDARADTSGEDPLPAACATDADCVDSLECTEGACVEGVCSWTVVSDACLIAAVCYSVGDSNPAEPCQICDAASSSKAWASRAGACDDDDACTEGEACEDGACAGGGPVACDDGKDCTDDTCVADIGCRALARSGDCDDDDACTEADFCVLGTCTGQRVPCDDGNDCTVEGCVGGGCSYVPAPDGGKCEDGDGCTSGDLCASSVCVAGDPVACDDGNVCTIDYCTKATGCGALPTQSPCCLGSTSVCDDANDCTVDSCDPLTADCSYDELDVGPCEDGEPCTGPDVCAAGECAGPAVACDDKNTCTVDACIPGEGCKGFPGPDGGSCDDGLACSTGDHCQSGVCAADKAECVCGVPTVDAVKVSAAQIGTDVKAGFALDLDSDPATCSPTGSCSGGVHNSFSVLAALANPALADAITGGSITLLFTAPTPLGSAFDVVLYQGESDPASQACDGSVQTCNYVVSGSNFDEACKPRFSLPATLVGDKLVAGSATSQIPFSIPFQGASLDVVVYAARLEATVEIVDGKLIGFKGILGGAVTKVALLAAVDGLPPDALPLPKEAVKSILESTIQYDIDTTGDGVGDAGSIALLVDGIDGVITGVVE